MGKQASLVLSDELLSQFYAFKENGNYDQQLVEKLLHYYFAQGFGHECGTDS